MPENRVDVDRPTFSPSFVHDRLGDDLGPALAYDGGGVRDWQQRLRPRLRDLLGLDAMPTDPPALNPRTLWRRDHPLGVIEKIVFTAEAGADVPAYLCLPNQPSADPPPVFVCLQGHSSGMHLSIAASFEDEDAPVEVEGDRDFALGCLRRGVAALAIEQRAFGERHEYRLPKLLRGDRCHDAAMHALLLGRTLLGERVYDVSRGVDYLHTRPEVDAGRIGVMGNSGGGTVSIYAAAVEPRIAYTMPSCAFCSWRGSILGVPHCSDNYVPRLATYAGPADVLGLFAPRPVVIVVGRDDDLFDIDGVREEFDTLRRIYTAAGAADACRLVIGNGGHRFYADAAWDSMLPLL